MRQRLISRITHSVAAREPGEGHLVLILADAAADPAAFLSELGHALSAETIHRISFLPADRGESGSMSRLLDASPDSRRTDILLIDDLHFADQDSLRTLLSTMAQGPRPRPTVVATTAQDPGISSATLIPLPPMSLAETSRYLRDRHGLPLPAASVEKLHRESGGSPRELDVLVAKRPVDDWLSEPASGADALALAAAHAGSGRFDAASVFLADAPAAGEDTDTRDALSAYLALYSGHRRQARDYVRASPTAPGAERLVRGAMIHLADWELESAEELARGAAEQAAPGSDIGEEAVVLAEFARTALGAHKPRPFPELNMLTDVGAQRARLFRGWAALAQDDPLLAREELRILPTDTPVLRLWQDAWLARTLYVLGDLSGAAGAVERGLSSAEVRGIELLTPLLLWTGAQTASMRGDDALARYYLSRLVLPQDSFLLQSLPAAMGRMIVTASTTDQAMALRAGEHLTSVVARAEIGQPGYWAWEDIYAQTLLRAGRIDEADALITTAEDSQGGAGLASVNARTAMIRAGIQLQRGDKATGFRTFSDAVDALKDLPMPTYLARVLFQYGQALRRYGRRSQADEIFAWAAQVYQTIGAPARVRECRAERRVGGVGGNLPSRTGLTPQEEQIVRLAVDGATNRAIATELTLSTKTVEYHLTSVYRKLGVQGRQELKARMGG